MVWEEIKELEPAIIAGADPDKGRATYWLREITGIDYQQVVVRAGRAYGIRRQRW